MTFLRHVVAKLCVNAALALDEACTVGAVMNVVAGHVERIAQSMLDDVQTLTVPHSVSDPRNN